MSQNLNHLFYPYLSKVKYLPKNFKVLLLALFRDIHLLGFLILEYFAICFLFLHFQALQLNNFHNLQFLLFLLKALVRSILLIY